jgi:fatty acid desaturase
MEDVASTPLPLAGSGTGLAELRRRFGESFRPRPAIYWADMLISAGLGWTLFAFAATAPPGSGLHLAATFGAVFALLRAALFIHELAHLKAAQLRGFETVWNLLVGIPVQVPSVMYVGSHMDHHRRHCFGTNDDPEYAPIAHWSRLRIALFVVTVAFVPLLLPLRWGVLGPLSRLFSPLRRLVVGKLSTLVINQSYTRPMPRGAQLARWNAEEAAAAACVWTAAAAATVGWLPLSVLAQWWMVVAGVLVLNQLRTLAAHGYENAGEPVDGKGQLLDSINLVGVPLLTALVAPVGLRYHALHHYLPGLPYHSLGTVHRRLLAELPPDSPYRATLRVSIVTALKKLWHRAAEGEQPGMA